MSAQDNPMQGKYPIDRVGKYTWEEFLTRVKSFHGYEAPGVLVGGIMVDMALEQMPEDVLFEAICETASCLPDSVQLLTPCTTGNKWLKIVNLGRYAVNLYDKHTGKGVRVYLDRNKLAHWGEMQAWFLKLKTKKEQDSQRLTEQIRQAGRSIYVLQPVQIKTLYLEKHSKGPIGICSVCGEAYPSNDGAVCLGCQGEAPYESPRS